jgi:hypothetical protein
MLCMISKPSNHGTFTLSLSETRPADPGFRDCNASHARTCSPRPPEASSRPWTASILSRNARQWARRARLSPLQPPSTSRACFRIVCPIPRNSVRHFPSGSGGFHNGWEGGLASSWPAKPTCPTLGTAPILQCTRTWILGRPEYARCCDDSIATRWYI